MTDESAAGRKTGQDNGRCDRVAGVMEERLADCNSVLGSFMAKVDKNGGYGEDDLRYLAAYLKIGAQLAGQSVWKTSKIAVQFRNKIATPPRRTER